MVAQEIAFHSACCFFIAGLAFGAWKWLQIRRSSNAQAHPYVDIAHRTALLYAFACMLLERVAIRSQLEEPHKAMLVAAIIGFFAFSVLMYVLHGLLADTTNQLLRPYRLARIELPPFVMEAFFAALIAVELGGFVALYAST